MKGKALSVDPSSGSFKNAQGTEINAVLAPYVVTVEKDTYYDLNGKVIDPTRSYVLIYDDEWQSYKDTSGKPVNMEKLLELVIYDPIT